MLHAIIMAGGTGTRFWPASRAATPKQMLKLVGDESMISQTCARFGALIPPERQMVVTNRRLVDSVKEHLPDLPDSSIVGEPCKRDTAPCIGLAALLVTRIANDPDATMLVCPADHVIPDHAAFQKAVQQAEQLVNDSPGRIVTFGVKPTYAAEIFGYIHRSSALNSPGGAAPAYKVESFVEKPNAEKAAEYLATGEFYWNSGIFVWKAATILDALRQHQPAMLEHLELIVDAWNTRDRDAVFEKEFTAIEGISIDYAVMENATDVAVVEMTFEWDDLGGWQSLQRRLGQDENGNTIVGKHLGLNTESSIIRAGDQHLVVTLGMKDCLVVHTDNATLVANKNDEESIRKVVKELESRGWTDYL